MPEAITPLTSLLQWWQRASLGQKLAAFVCAAICVSAVWTTVAIATRTDYQVLFSGLEEKDLGDIAARLQEEKVPYRLTGNGITVPSGRVHELRLKMASAGLPSGGSVGFELFDQNRLGLSEFQEKLNYRRALQGELERTIKQLSAVESARVHIALPERVLYAAQQEKPTASVTIKLRPGRELGDGEVMAMAHLVSSAVEGMPRENVTVLDTEGNLLTSPTTAAGSDQAILAQLKAQQSVEKQVGREIQAMLDRILGPGKSVVRVSAELDLSRRQTEEEMYQPAQANQGVVESQRQNRESYTGSGRSAARARRRGARVQRAAAPEPPESVGDNYERTESETRYRVSKRVQTVTNTAGQIKRMSVAVFVDDKAVLPIGQQLEQAVATAAGIDESRGDKVILQRIAFAAPPKDTVNSVVAKVNNLYEGNARNLFAVALLLVFAFLARGLFKATPVMVQASEPRSVTVGTQPLSLTSAEPAMPMLGPPSTEGATMPGLDPDRTANVVRNWLSRSEES